MRSDFGFTKQYGYSYRKHSACIRHPKATALATIKSLTLSLWCSYRNTFKVWLTIFQLNCRHNVTVWSLVCHIGPKVNLVYKDFARILKTARIYLGPRTNYHFQGSLIALTGILLKKKEGRMTDFYNFFWSFLLVSGICKD